MLYWVALFIILESCLWLSHFQIRQGKSPTAYFLLGLLPSFLLLALWAVAAIIIQELKSIDKFGFIFIFIIWVATNAVSAYLFIRQLIWLWLITVARQHTELTDGQLAAVVSKRKQFAVITMLIFVGCIGFSLFLMPPME